MSVAEVEEELYESMCFHVSRTISAHINNYRDKDIGILKWPKMLQKCKKLLCNVKNLSSLRNLVFKEVRYWRKPYLNFFLHRVPSSNSSVVIAFVKEAATS